MTHGHLTHHWNDFTFSQVIDPTIILVTQTRELVELRVHIHEWISVIMRAAQKDRGNVVHGKCNDYPKRPRKMRNADLGQKIVA